MANITTDLSQLFNRLRLVEANKQRLGRLVAAFLVSKVKQRMADEKDPYNVPYKKHSDNYVRRTAGGRALPRPYKILKDKGLLANSIKGKSNSGKITLSSALKYAATHQYGRGNIPARPFLLDDRGIPNDIKPELKELVKNFVRSLQ